MKKIVTKNLEKMQLGLNTVADAVKSTYGPGGHNVIISRKDSDGVIVTKDGETVAKNISLKDEIEDAGAKIIKEASNRANKVAGDGTTATAILTQALVKEGLKEATDTGTSTMVIKKEWDEALPGLLETLASITKEITKPEEIVAIASISANNKEDGELVASILQEVGVDGFISLENGNTETVVEHKAGFLTTPACVSPESAKGQIRSKFENAAILTVEGHLEYTREVICLSKPLNDISAKAMVLVCNSASDQVKKMLTYNNATNKSNIYIIETNTDEIYDIAAKTDGKIINREAGAEMKKVSGGDFGSCLSVVSDKTGIMIMSEANEERVAERIAHYKETASPEESTEKIAKLTEKIASIKIGAPTFMEMIERLHRVEDALNSTRHAMQNGYVIGGAMAYVLMSLTKDSISASLISALDAPFKQLLLNTGREELTPEEADGFGLKDDFGMDFSTMELKNLKETGIIDPADVIKSSLTHAISAAGMFITTSTVIVDEETNEETL